MRIGITGTQNGATEDQMFHLSFWLHYLGATEVHHGDCIGADAQAHDLARRLGLRTVIYPPSNLSKRAFCDGDVVLTPMLYLDRNRAVVNATEHLIALPATTYEINRSGTWATVRYARSIQRPVQILLP